MPADKLIYMANQIGRHFVSQKNAAPEIGIADHLRRFWDPRMRSIIIAYVQNGGAELLPDVQKAVRLLDN